MKEQSRRIALLQGHPDPSGRHLLHVMGDGYREAALAAGHQVKQIDVAKLDFPWLRTQADFESGTLPESLKKAREDLLWANHWLILFPLWHGMMPALLKGFLEQIFRPGFAFEYRKAGFPKKLLSGRSARIVVTMGMPAFFYRWYFGAFGVRSLERSILAFAGIKPIRENLYGLAMASAHKRAGWIGDMQRHGRRGD